MRIKSSHIISETRIDLTGQEAWLDAIYKDFATPQPDHRSSPIVGSLALTRQGEEGAIRVEGQIDYTPIVSCARCDKAVPWPLVVQVDALVLPEDHTPLPKDLQLSEEELECYRMVDDELDLEVLVNDAVQTALPSQYLAASEDGKSCRLCGLDISDAKVFSAGSSDTASPFAALRGLKVK